MGHEETMSAYVYFEVLMGKRVPVIKRDLRWEVGSLDEVKLRARMRDRGRRAEGTEETAMSIQDDSGVM